MAPQHIDELPRHEEPRQLMLGLIDDLPQERRGIRQAGDVGVVVGVVGPRSRAVCRSGLGHGAKWATWHDLTPAAVAVKRHACQSGFRRKPGGQEQ